MGAIPPPPFLSVSPLESMRSGGAIPPLKRGISAILARYPMKTRQMGAIPPSAILSRKGIARYGGGGISHWAAKLIMTLVLECLNQAVRNGKTMAEATLQFSKLLGMSLKCSVNLLVFLTGPSQGVHAHLVTSEISVNFCDFLIIRKVWVSINFLSAKFGFTPAPPPKGPQMIPNCTNQ